MRLRREKPEDSARNFFCSFCLLFYRNCFDVQFVELLVGDVARCIHHDVLCILVHRERNDLTDGVFAGKEHDHTVNARSDTGMRRSTIAECIVHGRELRLNVFLAETNHLEGLDHDLRIVVSDGTGGKLNAVYNEVVLICCDCERIDLATFCF